MIGQTVSHYRIVDLVGAGGMGVVYKAEDTRLGRTVALKFLPLELTQDKDARERLRIEAQTASALDHPNICTIHEIDDTADGRVFVAMSFYDGQSLKERIAEGPLPIAEVIRLSIDLARGMAAAHDAGVIHRDIKPANVMLTKRGDLKIVDFGVAKNLDRTELTRTGVTVGTIAYMAPEYLLGAAADAQTDVWAIGVVLYEMLTGRLPFDGDHSIAIMNAIANSTLRPLKQIRADVPAELDVIVMRALEKPRAARFQTVRELQQALESLQITLTQRSGGTTTVATAPLRPRLRAGVAVMVTAAVMLLAAGGFWMVRSSRAREARQAIAQLHTLVQEENYTKAFRLMRALEPSLVGDADFDAARSALMLPGEVQTTPEGADLYIKGYDEPDADWIYLGRAPLKVRAPIAYFRWRIVKAGFVTFEGSGEAGAVTQTFTLSPEGTVPEGMVRVPEGTRVVTGVGVPTVPIEAFFIDRHEVTNRQYKAFVDAGGYSKPEYWREAFVKDGRTISREAAMSQLRDATGQPGPATWELRAYPAGQDDLPVGGLSWYEALAYAAWAGRELPTVHHWRAAAPGGIFSNILEFSNFSNKAVPVGAFKGIGPFGTFDMAGNVREWCTNGVGTRRYILGGAWNMPNYMYQQADALDPFDRNAVNGVRTIKRTSATPVPEALSRPTETLARDYSRETPVSDREFEIFRRLYAYDRDDLKVTVESTDESPELWRVERVSYAAAYGGERITAYLFLPKKGSAPYQTVVYFPHSGGEYLQSFEQSEMNYLGFVLRSGRALFFPMYKGTYERRLSQMPTGTIGRRDLAISRMKDLQRSVDYLQSRSDIDHARLAYFGVSLGARLGAVALAVEKRFATAVLWSGGFRTALTPVAPEIDEINFAPRVTTPVLMLNGAQDFAFPVETAQKPMFRLFATPEADKKLVIYEGGHVFPFARIIKDTLDWLDKYLGVPKY